MIRRPHRRGLLCFAADRRGATVIEFAIVLPLLLLLICGAIDMGFLFMAQTTLNGAVMEGAQIASSSMERSEADRLATLRDRIKRSMAAFSGQTPTINATVYRKFGDSFPEDYIDANHNGRYDGPSGTFPGEAFTDRNSNGTWDADVAVTTGTSLMGGTGDVVTYSATLPVRHLFGVISWEGLGLGRWAKGDVTLKSVAVMRNEATKSE